MWQKADIKPLTFCSISKHYGKPTLNPLLFLTLTLFLCLRQTLKCFSHCCFSETQGTFY